MLGQLIVRLITPALTSEGTEEAGLCLLSSSTPQLLLTQTEAFWSLWWRCQDSTPAGRQRQLSVLSSVSTGALRAQWASTHGRCPCRPHCRWPPPCPKATSVGVPWFTPAGCSLQPTALSRCPLGRRRAMTGVPAGSLFSKWYLGSISMSEAKCTRGEEQSLY